VKVTRLRSKKTKENTKISAYGQNPPPWVAIEKINGWNSGSSLA
jgi:hypothetical protein